MNQYERTCCSLVRIISIPYHSNTNPRRNLRKQERIDHAAATFDVVGRRMIAVSRHQSSKSSLLCKIAVLFPPSHAHCVTLYSRIENSNAHLRRSLGFCLSRMIPIESFSISRLQSHARSRPDQKYFDPFVACPGPNQTQPRDAYILVEQRMNLDRLSAWPSFLAGAAAAADILPLCVPCEPSHRR